MPARPAELVREWQRVHAVLTASAQQAALSLSELSAFTIYFYCAYKAFGQEQDAALVQSLFLQLTPQATVPLLVSEGELDDLRRLAWLSRRLADEPGLAPAAGLELAALDQGLLEQARRLRLEAAARGTLFGVLRYFTLRWPAAPAERGLRELLAHLLEPGGPAEAKPQGLGLAEGLAGELLALIRVYQAGIKDEAIPQTVRAGIVRLLSLRREVDFLGQHYSIFPDQLSPDSGQAEFSTELSWRRGDLGQVLLLYRAHELLQDAELAKIAELVGLNTLLRTSAATTGVSGGGWQQGAAGLAQLYWRLQQLSGLTAYEQGYAFWLDQTRQWMAASTVAPAARPGDLRHGLVGGGLVLLTAVAGQVPDWDAVLL